MKRTDCFEGVTPLRRWNPSRFPETFYLKLRFVELSRGVLYVSMVLAALVFKVELISTLV